VCGGELVARVLECKVCGTQVHGKFLRSPFDRLDDEQTEFLLEFLRSEGNFTELARRMNLSFPTVKSRFYAILRTLGIEKRRKTTVSNVLDMLERGEISADEAEKLLRGEG